MHLQHLYLAKLKLVSIKLFTTRRFYVKNKISILLICCFIFVGCTLGASNNKVLKDRINNHCGDKCKFNSFVAQVEIDKVGIYALAKVNHEEEEKLMFAWYDLSFKNDSPEMISSKIYTDNYEVFENLDDEYGHGFNYYIYMIHAPVKRVYYNNNKLETQKYDFTLNDQKDEMTAFIIKLKAPEKIDENLLIIE